MLSRQNEMHVWLPCWLQRAEKEKFTFHSASVGRAMFVTSKGFIGLAPWNAQQKSVPFGGWTSIPFILFKATGQENNRLVGEAYVYGTIGGESFSGGEWDTQGWGILILCKKISLFGFELFPWTALSTPREIESMGMQPLRSAQLSLVAYSITCLYGLWKGI